MPNCSDSEGANVGTRLESSQRFGETAINECFHCFEVFGAFDEICHEALHTHAYLKEHVFV